MSGHIVKKEVTEEGEVSAAVTHIIIFFLNVFLVFILGFGQTKKNRQFYKRKTKQKT